MAKKKEQAAQTSQVNIVDGKLILSLADAETPVVWQMDMQAAKSAALSVQEDKKKKVFILTSKKEDGSIDEIAAYKDKQDAVDVLMEASNALQNAHGQINAAAKSGKAANDDGLSKNDKVGAGLAAALIIVLFLIWMLSASARLDVSEGDMSDASYATSSSADPRNSAGVPVSADDFLTNR